MVQMSGVGHLGYIKFHATNIVIGFDDKIKF